MMNKQPLTIDGLADSYQANNKTADEKSTICGWQLYAPMGGACAYFAKTGSPWFYIPAAGFGAASVYDFVKQAGLRGLATALYDAIPQQIKSAIPPAFLRKAKKKAA